MGEKNFRLGEPRKGARAMDELSLPHRHGEGRDTLPLARQLSRIEHFQTVADLFKQLDDPTRLRLFWLLCHCEECVVNLSALMNMSSPALSHHLRALKTSGLIVSRRVGKEVYYRAADTERSRLLHQMMERIMEITCPEDCGGDAGDAPPELLDIVRDVHDPESGVQGGLRRVPGGPHQGPPHGAGRQAPPGDGTQRGGHRPGRGLRQPQPLYRRL